MSVVPEVKSRVTDEELVQRRRSQIVAAAVELFAHQGYYRTTILDVARKAGVSAGLIYQYVSDKDDVLLLALLNVLDSYKKEIPAALKGLTDPLERWHATVQTYCRVVNQQRQATVLAYRSTKSLPKERREVIKQSEVDTNEMIADCVRDCIAEGLFRPVNADLVAYHMATFAHAWALKHWRLKDLCTLDQYVASGLDFFAHALLTPKGWRRYRAFQARQAAPAAGRRAAASGDGHAARGRARSSTGAR